MNSTKVESTPQKELPMKEKSLLELFDSCNFNNSITIHDTDEDLESEDDEDYGDEDTILSMSTSRRSILPCEISAMIPPLLPTVPPPLNEKFWCEPDGITFKVRDKSYMKNKKKSPSKSSLFRLFAVDIVEMDEPLLTGVCAHPDERVQQCLKAQKEGKAGSELPPFIFCVNIVVPGSPSYHALFYYAVDDIALISPQALDPESNVISPNPEFTKLAAKFFFGPSDKFRDKTFKLIPRIAKGNFVVKKAVGTKPALLGTKVKQHYVQAERYFELIVDIGSDSIAKNVVGLSRGYAETLVVDMGFLLEGKTPETLPEQIMGTVRLSNLSFKKTKFRKLRKV